MKFYFAFVLLLIRFYCIAQTPPSFSSSDILSGLKKLHVLGSVLYIAAHPDDENTRLLAYFAKEKLYRTGYLSLTRGDGGQNLTGDEQGVELGLIRTQELLAARRIDGAEQFFSRAFDFGFSKRTAEALATWNEEKILADAVWVIRKFQPDIIVTRFPKDSRAGHGHHSASAVIAEEAFIAAGDPSRFPEQLQYVKPWKAKRLLWNTFNFGSNNTQSEDQFKMNVGIFNPLFGKSYGEIAAESRSQHKSQGFGVARQRGVSMEYFVTWQGAAPKADIMDGVDLSWSRTTAKEFDKDIRLIIQSRITTIKDSFEYEHPEKSVKALIQLYKIIQDNITDAYWREQKLKDIKQLTEACSGLWIEAATANAFAKKGDTIKVSFLLNDRNGSNITLNRISMDGFDTTLTTSLKPDQNLIIDKIIPVSVSMPVSQPYWLKNPMKPGYFDITDQQLIGDADSKPALTAHFFLSIEGVQLEIVKPVLQKYTDPVKGELYQPVAIIPAKEDPRFTLRTINHDHIPRIVYFKAEQPATQLPPIKIKGKKIGYIEGAGDKVMAALQEMGYEITLLTDKELEKENLLQYQAIITGVRAYNVHASLDVYYDKLMKYIENGGNLIVQYNTSSQLGPVKARIGPYPFTISRNRITEENADVKILHPHNPILNYPNKITAADFEGWVQERSIYHAQGWDPRYSTLFAMHDEGEKDDEGSLIMTKYGKGYFVYTGLVFYRELPARVPGAYKLMANMISLH
jgi:LmbE family N-acetylglucosaminyl deacetylase